jgi:hypothetical protein
MCECDCLPKLAVEFGRVLDLGANEVNMRSSADDDYLKTHRAGTRIPQVNARMVIAAASRGTSQLFSDCVAARASRLRLPWTSSSARIKPAVPVLASAMKGFPISTHRFFTSCIAW